MTMMIPPGGFYLTQAAGPGARPSIQPPPLSPEAEKRIQLRQQYQRMLDMAFNDPAHAKQGDMVKTYKPGQGYLLSLKDVQGGGVVLVKLDGSVHTKPILFGAQFQEILPTSSVLLLRDPSIQSQMTQEDRWVATQHEQCIGAFLNPRDQVSAFVDQIKADPMAAVTIIQAALNKDPGKLFELAPFLLKWQTDAIAR